MWKRFAVGVGVVAALGLAVSVSGSARPPESVARWRAGLQTFSTGDGQSLAYVDAGPKRGPVVVLMHGLPTSSFEYREVITSLAAQGVRVIAPDLIGFGGSSKPEAEAPYAFGLQAERVLALLDGLGVKRFNLVVHDLGGLVSWELLERQPERVERLLVLDTTAYAEAFSPPPQMRQLGGALGGAMTAMMRSDLLGPTLTRSFVAENLGDPDRLDRAAVDGFWWPLHEGATVPMRAVARHFDDLLAQFPRYAAALRRFDGPAMLLWGAKDRVLAFEKNAPRFAADLRIPPERVRSLPDAAHFVPIDHPAEVSAAVVELLRLPAPPAADAGR